MHIISALLVGLAANLDNFGVGVSYGVQKIRIPSLSNFFIGLLSGMIAFISVFTGHLLSRFMTIANIFGALIIIGIGIWVILHKSTKELDLPAAVPAMKTYSISIKPLSTIIQITKNPSYADIDANGFISAKEAVALGLTLSFNCIATGVGAGLTGLSPLPLAVSIFFFSIVTISLGYLTGWKTASNRLERWSQTLSGALLIAIGIFELLN
jgi:putative sporulation protein YtaF